MQSSIKEIIGGSLLGIVGKILGACLNFVALPILLTVYGKSEYGLVGIALSTNAFLQIMNMGVPTGAVRQFAGWIESKDFESLKRGVQTNLFYFVVIGVVNSCILFYLGWHAEAYFKVADPGLLRMLIYTLAITSFLNWCGVTFQHLLLAYEKIRWVNLGTSIVSVLNFVAALIAYWTHTSLEIYFLFYSLSVLAVIPFNLYLCKKLGILNSSYFVPILRKKESKIIFSYSMGLFGMSILQYLANQSQPLILGTMNENGDTAVANYRILQNVTMLVSMMGTIFLQSFLPYVSKINHRGSQDKIKDFVFDSTKWLSILIFFICFYISFNSDKILQIYVGKSAEGLSGWLSIWILGLLFLSNQGVGSMILGAGKFKKIIIGLAFASFASVSFSILNVKTLGVGVAAISYLMYKCIEGAFIYGYYLPKMAKISPLQLLNKASKLPFLFSIASIGVVKVVLILINVKNNFLYLSISGITSFILYVGLIWMFFITDKERTLFGRYLNFGSRIKERIRTFVA